MSENEEVDNVQHPDAWRSLPEDVLHASAHRAQLRRKRGVRLDPRWMRCHWPEELVPRHGTKSGARRGVDKSRHLETRTLWLQKHITGKEILLTRQKGSENPSDLGTKHLDQAKMWKHVAALGFEKHDGKSELSLRATPQARAMYERGGLAWSRPRTDTRSLDAVQWQVETRSS